jgi:predicted TIM-barrel fold metal-dependent hydrolase
MVGPPASVARAAAPRIDMYNVVSIHGPQITKPLMRRFQVLGLTPEQREYLDHKGAYDPHARVRDLDLMGIDQVLVIGTAINNHVAFIENPDGATVFCEAYNNWLRDWCAEEPDRLFGAGVLPLQRPDAAAAEVRRLAELGFPVALIRPIDGSGGYPSFPNSKGPRTAGLAPFTRPLTAGVDATMDGVFKAFEETGLCLGMHTFPSPTTFGPFVGAGGNIASPGDLVYKAGVSANTLSFVFEAQAWLGQVLLSGFLDRYPRLKMLIFESNSQWLPVLLEECDRMFKLYKNERQLPAERLPSEAFYQQCAISFESDETPTHLRWRRFEEIGIWSSDAYHQDAADAWSAIREMREAGVPEEVQAKLMGGNATRLYGIEPKLFVTDEPDRMARPDWFPDDESPEFREWAELMKFPRHNVERLRELGGFVPVRGSPPPPRR